jgi:hypothetical protein
MENILSNFAAGFVGKYMLEQRRVPTAAKVAGAAGLGAAGAYALTRKPKPAETPRGFVTTPVKPAAAPAVETFKPAAAPTPTPTAPKPAETPRGFVTTPVKPAEGPKLSERAAAAAAVKEPKPAIAPAAVPKPAPAEGTELGKRVAAAVKETPKPTVPTEHRPLSTTFQQAIKAERGAKDVNLFKKTAAAARESGIKKYMTPEGLLKKITRD